MSDSLELSPETFRGLVERATERICEHLRSLPEQPAAASESGAELARQLREPLPRQGVPFEQLLETLFDEVIPVSFNTAGPGYLAYIPGGGILHAAVADLIASAVNRYVGVWLAAPGLVQLEINAVRWLCEMVGYPEGALGLLTSGGSMANLTALTTARVELLGERFLDGTLYVSDQVHHSVVKAARLAGLPRAAVRVVPSDGDWRIRSDLLQKEIAEDRQRGRRPFLVVASAGTTNTGAVDDLPVLAHIARREGLWLHVDGAYGGFFALTERGRQRLAALELADSITLDPHKGLFLPYGTGCLLVRNPATLYRTHHLEADYMPALQESPDQVDFSEISPELSRGFRGLRVWLPLKMHGVEPFRQALDEKLDLARSAAAELEEMRGMKVVARPQLSIVAFRLAPPGLSGEACDQLNRELLARVNGRKRVFLTATTLAGRFTLRICVLSVRTHADRLQMALDDIRDAVSDLLPEA